MAHVQDFLHAVPNDFVAALLGSLVAMLQHESPYCIAAAASVLARIGRVEGVGRAWIETSGAIPALIHVVEKLTRPSDLEKETGLFRRYAHDQRLFA